MVEHEHISLVKSFLQIKSQIPFFPIASSMLVLGNIGGLSSC